MRPVLLRCISTEKIRELDPFNSQKEYVTLLWFITMKYKINPYYYECVRWFQESGLKMGIKPFPFVPILDSMILHPWGLRSFTKQAKLIKSMVNVFLNKSARDTFFFIIW
jgi:hypothetical protein